MTVAVAVTLVGLALFVVGVSLGAFVLAGALGVACALAVVGAGLVVFGVLFDFERGS